MKREEPIFVEVRYTVKNGKREEFCSKVIEQGIAEASRAEEGNMRDEFFYPVENANEVFLIEIWKDEESKKNHGTTEHYMKLTELKSTYVENVQIKCSYQNSID